MEIIAPTKKLKLKPGAPAAVIVAPPGYLDRLGAPPDIDVKTTLNGPLDWVSLRDYPRAPAASSLAPNGHAWISYPKGSSKMQTDLTRDKGWEPLEGSDLMLLSLVSVDERWSAFGLRPYKPGEARQTFR